MGEVRLHWLPLGAGGHVVRHTGSWYERVVARREHRPACPLFHAALEVHADRGRFVIEMGPAWGQAALRPGDRGVVAAGSVGCRGWGRSRYFRYEIRCWRDGTIPDLRYAVGGPHVVAGGTGAAERLLGLVAQAPVVTWGRDELHAGEMWNSNSLVAWLLASSGHSVDGLGPPDGGRAPGWRAGLVVAARSAGVTR